MKVGITGHQRIQDSGNWSWVEKIMLEELGKLDGPLVGITSLAMGADQLFAKSVLKLRGALHVVIPFEGYASKFATDSSRKMYNQYLGKAEKVETLPKQATDEHGYMKAGMKVVDLCDILMAVWNGKKAAGLGGTGDIVEYAVKIGKLVIHLNPDVKGLSIIA